MSFGLGLQELLVLGAAGVFLVLGLAYFLFGSRRDDDRGD